MESANSSVGSLCHQYHHQSLLPPGFRFHPTDEELVVHYLKKKTVSAPLPVSIITEIDLYKFDPWELPAKAVFGEQEWYFFSPRERKYPNGARPNRAATSGYWKATGTDKAIMTGGGTKRVGVKKALVFYGGKPPKGIKTNWIMHEYRLTDNKAKSLACDITNKKSSLKLDDWVLCRIYKKNHDYTTSDHIIGSLQQHDQKLPALNAHHLFDRMSLINTSISSHLGCSAASERRLLAAAGANSIAQFWNDDVEASPARRFLEDGNGDGGSSGSINECGSIASLLSQFPQTPPTLNQQSLLGSIGDGLMRQPYQLHGLNW